MGLQQLLTDQCRRQPAELWEIERGFGAQRNTRQFAELLVID